MGLGDFLTGIDASINNFIADHNQSYADYMERDRARIAADEQRNEHPSFFKALSTGGENLGAVDAAVRDIPGVGHILDAPSRSWDTMFLTAQHAVAVGHQNHEADNFSWGEMLNRDNWARAWGTWGSETHVTAGQILGASLSDSDGIEYADPFAAKDAKAIQAAASDTWLGEVAGATTDLAFSMMMPGLGTASAVTDAARSTRVVATAADAERIAQRVQQVDHTELVGSAARDTANALLSRPQNDDSLIGRLATSVSKTDGIHDLDSMSTYLSPLMEDATPGARVAVADLFTQANKLEDEGLRTQVKMNALLAAHGSSTARGALIEDHPLLAKNLEEMTSAPRGVTLASDLADARRAGASDPTVNGVLDRHFGLASDKAEIEALRKQVDADADEARLAAEMRNSARPGSEDRKAGQELVDEAQAQLAYSKDALVHKKVGADWNAADADAHLPGLERANLLLNEIWSLGESEIATGRVIPSHLDNVKTRLRMMAGDEVTLEYGDGNTPVIVKSLATRAAKWMMAPQARGAISLVEPDLGANQLADALRRSGQYTAAEIKATKNTLLTTDPARRQDVIAHTQKDMLERIALKHFPDDTPEDALRHAKELTQSSMARWGEGNEWVARAANEQKGEAKVMYRTPDGVAVSVDEPMLQSQLADSAPFLDPEVFDKAIVAQLPGIRNNLRHGVDALTDLNDTVTALWKHGALLRPGLAVRAGLDTEMRAAALMGAAGSWMQAVNGAANMVRNTRTSAVSRVLFGDKVLDKAAMKRLSVDMTPVRVDVGDGKKSEFRFAADAAQRTSNQSAMTKGADTPWKFYFTETQKHLNRFRTDRAKWARFKADSQHWDESYIEYAEQLLASPTAKWLLKHRAAQTDLTEMLDSPAFSQEYAKVGQPKGYTRWEFARQVMHEVDLMFPEGSKVADALSSEKITKAMVTKQFPKGHRFDIPGPDRSVIDTSWTESMRELTGKAYRVLLDKPDMWLARNPTGTHIYRQQLQDEVAAMRRGLTEGDSLSASDMALADRRARAKAISVVRRTFFDTTRYTAMHKQVARISPFFAAWEDAMISWSRLIYDDPRRLIKLSGAYNAAGTLNPYLPQPLLVDNDGKPLRRGEAHENGSYIAVPFKVGGVQMRVRLEALNSIAQGEVWWLPGFGPQTTVSTTQILNRFVPDDVVLDMVGTDNWLGKTLLDSMYLNGELPRGDLGSAFGSVMPSTLRNLYKDIWGDNFAANLQRNANFRIAEATKKGQRLDDKALKKIYDDAGKTAFNAAVVRAISGGGLGLTGSAVVDGQFYVEQMRQIEAVPPEQLKAMGFSSPEEYFSHLYPDAADLDMHLSRNETGVRASVQAQKSFSRLKNVLSDHPDDIGWMVLGRENVNTSGADDFSGSAYGMQVSSGARTKQSAEEIEQHGRAAVGWRQWSAAQADLAAAADELGMSMTDPIIADTKRQYKELLMQRNAAFAADVTTMERKSEYYYSQAKALSKDSRVANRSDMVAFRDYDQARQELLDQTGLTTLTGSSPDSLAAAATLRQVGETLAARDYGFDQMWQRFLSRETEKAASLLAKPAPAETQAVMFGG